MIKKAFNVLNINQFLIMSLFILLSGNFTLERINIEIFASFQVSSVFSIISLIYIIKLIVFDHIKLWHHQINRQVVYNYLLIIGYFTLLLVSILWSSNSNIALLKWESIIKLLILVLSTHIIVLNLEVKQIFNTTRFFFVVVGLVYLMIIFYSLYVGRFRGTIYIGGPNVATRLLFFSMVFQFSFIKKNIVWIFPILFTFLGIIALGSRAGIIFGFIGLIGLFVAHFKMIFSQKLFSNSQLLIAISIIFLVLLFVFINPIKEVFDIRIINQVIVNFSFSNRDVIYIKTIEMILKKPIFGHGLNAYAILMGNRWGYPHNLILESLLEVGFFGAIILSIQVFYSFYLILITKHKFIIYYVTILIYMLLVSQLSGDIYDFRYFYFFMLIAVNLTHQRID
jgi:O-antigen ligase